MDFTQNHLKVQILIKAVLALEDETIINGSGFGYPRKVSGEVVFNTGMVGYTESLTDPSYFGQILIQTYPLVGNYGVPSYSITDEFGIPLYFESNRIQVKGYAIYSLAQNPSHWSYKKTLNEWMYEQKISCIEGIDTRELTKKIRVKGTMLGILKIAKEIDYKEIMTELGNIEDPNKRDLVREVTIKKPIEYNFGRSIKIVMIDCGTKYGILRNLLKRKVDVVRVPYDYSVENILKLNPSGVVISNGPGDPKKCEKTIKTVREIIETNIPVMGICLGNQILALAAGADTYKMKFGHRGQNHPCMDVSNKRCYITTQNHGYVVEDESLKETGFDIWFKNVNDKTVEGIKHKKKPVFGIQFHPEASPGPYETGSLFDYFIEKAKRFGKV